ncbi:transporter substrate-binding domain-containing protein [uncultured Oscillibacter sp.]|uniref:transporter substrate-binding domain-containing protein n=1 Tax=uncultured Oscillibacter sp. TaxID=876091 RepID=UPI0025D7E372|nr:transporter substrate-binding domain-containing protein [uncultured Oscillibacter sp.]
MKKFLTLMLALAMVLSLAACGGKDADDSSPSDAGTQQPADTGSDDSGDAGSDAADWKTSLTTINAGKLTVATSPDFAPYEFYAIADDGTATLAGFDMDLAQYIADYLGLELEVVPMDFDGTIMELQQGNVDLGMAGYSPDPKRAGAMDFSDVYITGGQSFVCLQENKDKFPDLASANNPDYQIGAQVGSIQADLAKEHTPDADIIELAKVPDILAELLTGKMDGAFIETMVAESYAASYPELCVVLDVPYDAKGSVVGVSKGNAALLAGVNEAINAALSDGSFDQYVVDAVEQASGNIVEGLIEE